MADKKKGADASGLPAITLRCEPYSGHSIVTITVSSRVGRDRVDHRLARWHLSLARSDLAGHSTDDVLLLIMAMVVRRIESGRTDPADRHNTADRPTAVGPGAPGGGHGGGMIDVPLPGLGAAPPGAGSGH